MYISTLYDMVIARLDETRDTLAGLRPSGLGVAFHRTPLRGEDSCLRKPFFSSPPPSPVCVHTYITVRYAASVIMISFSISTPPLRFFSHLYVQVPNLALETPPIGELRLQQSVYSAHRLSLPSGQHIVLWSKSKYRTDMT